jgi:hypothetical protein
MEVLRLLPKRQHQPLPLLYLHNHALLRVATLVRTLAPAIGIGLLVGLAARGFGGMGWVYAVLILSAAVVALAQQTLPWGPNAVQGIACSDGHRNQSGSSWIGKAVVYSLSSAFAGLVVGALLGIAGSFLPLGFRGAIGSALAVIAVVAGSLELFGRRIKPLQFDCQTPRRWMQEGPLRWAIRNGLALGFGATSRVGFLLWYVVPLGALLFGSPAFGAAIYGTYGLVRGVAAPLILLGMIRKKADFSDWFPKQNKPMQVLAAGQLVLLGVTVAIALGS